MAQEPKKKHSKGRKRTRRASIKLDALGLVVCLNCQQPVVPHQVCKSCGFFKGKQIVVKTKAQVTRA